MEEAAGERGKRIIGILAEAGRRAGLSVELEYPVVGGRIDVVWLWRGPAAFPLSLPLVAFEVESSWRTRKHLKGDLLNLLDLQPSLGVIILLGEGEDVESTRRFTKQMVDRRIGRVEVWAEKDVLALAADQENTTRRLLSDVPAGESGNQMVKEVTHSGKYRALAAWLASQSTDRVSASFKELEEILGFPLPPSSRKRAAHWYSYEGSAVVRAVKDAGWEVVKLSISAESVTFGRVR